MSTLEAIALHDGFMDAVRGGGLLSVERADTRLGASRSACASPQRGHWKN
jgi:hypothetical protein